VAEIDRYFIHAITNAASGIDPTRRQDVKSNKVQPRRSPNPMVSVIIPCRNEKDHIAGCLLSIFKQEDVPGDFEVIIADGMSEDGTREILNRIAEREPRLMIVDNPNQIVSTGLNAAIRAARGEVIVRMDVHTDYAGDYLRECLTSLRETGADNVGGPARTETHNYIQSAIGAAYHSPFSAGGARFHNVDYEGYVDTVTYGCWRKQIFDRIGLFDEELVRNQDDELNLRLIRAGGKIWQSPRIQSWYQPRSSIPALFRQYMQYGYWKVRVIQKHKIPASWRHLAPGMFMLALFVLAAAAPWSSFAAWTEIVLVAAYAVCNIAASLLTAASSGWKLLPLLPVVFFCYHFGYGFGFLWGIVDSVILRRKPRARFTELTRSVRKSSCEPAPLTGSPPWTRNREV
jgi:glycosyltransferase involved in cell wall biosynthesis